MRLADIAIRRPVFTTMFIGALVVFGLFSFQTLGVDLFPKVDFPTVLVTTTLPGASPEEVESQITKPIEESVNTIQGIDELRSISGEGFSRVIVRFLLERDIDQAAQDVREKVATIVGDFPEGTDPPIVEKFDSDAAPVLSIALSSQRDLREITEIADKRIKQYLESAPGVGAITIVGGRKREIQVFLDKDKLVANHLTVQQVKTALAAQNMEMPAGRINEGSRELVLRTMGRLARPADFMDLVVTSVNGRPIRLADLGYVEDGVEEPRDLARLDGQRAVLLNVRKQSGTNTIKVVDGVMQRLKELSGRLPADIKLAVIRDQSIFVRKSLKEIKLHLLLGSVLASLVILLFIRDLRTTLIAATAIPTSIIATFAFIKFQGFTLNIMSMLGITVAVGIVIDDAIVVLENIYRHLEEKGSSPAEAAKKATSEIGLAVMATTLSLVVIFLPVAFMAGMIGRFMYQFGLTLAFAIMVSLLIAFTLTPMLCSRFLKLRGSADDKKRSKETRFYSLLERGYGRLLGWSLSHRWAIVLFSLAIFLASFPLFQRVGKDVLPNDDREEFEIVIQTPEGSTLAATDTIIKEIEREVWKLPGVKHVLTTIGQNTGNVTEGFVYVRLVPLNKRDFSQFDVMKQARKMLAQFPWLRTSVEHVSSIRGGGFRQTPLNFSIRGPDLDKLEELSNQAVDRIKKIPGIVDVDTTLASRKPELRVEIDREKAADLGVRVADIATSLNILVAGEEVTKYKEGAEQYPVRLRLKASDRSDLDDILELAVPSSKLGYVRLKNLIQVREEKGPVQIERQARQRQVTVLGNLVDKPLGEALAEVRRELNNIDWPPGYTTEFTGRARFLAEMKSNFIIAFLLSIIFMYMVLASQFESFVHPITIMISLPLSIPFALLSLYLTGGTLNIYSSLGILLLFGIVKKNAILQVDYANNLIRRGVERDQAVKEACRARLRPILMTTITLVAAMTPMALGKGSGSASRAALALVVVGGQSLCLLITLLVTPVVYTIFEDLKQLRIPGRLRKRG